jgi:hypothetical protein
MKPLQQLIFVSALTFCCPSCSNKKDVKEDSIEIKEVIMTHESEHVAPPSPPPPGASGPVYKFKTLEEWLGHICKSEKSEQDSLTYNFGIYQSIDDSTNKPTEECLLSLVGTVTYNETPTYSVSKIKFQPEEDFFRLPKEDCEGLTHTQIQDRLTRQLTKFSKTEKFKHSFFKTANEITVNGRKIWPE